MLGVEESLGKNIVSITCKPVKPPTKPTIKVICGKIFGPFAHRFQTSSDLGGFVGPFSSKKTVQLRIIRSSSLVRDNSFLEIFLESIMP